MKKINKLRLNSNGFTLVEVIMTILILGILFAIITPMIIQAFNIFDISTRRMSVNQLAEVAKDEFSRYLMTVTGEFETPTDYNSIEKTWSFRGYHPENSKNTVLFEIIYNDEKKEIYMNIDNGNIEDNKLIAYNVTNFDIINDNGLFKVEIEITDNKNTIENNFTVISRNN